MILLPFIYLPLSGTGSRTVTDTYIYYIYTLFYYLLLPYYCSTYMYK